MQVVLEHLGVSVRDFLSVNPGSGVWRLDCSLVGPMMKILLLIPQRYTRLNNLKEFLGRLQLRSDLDGMKAAVVYVG